MKDDHIIHDRDMREPLFDFLEEKFGKIRILEEKQIGKVRSDVVMVTPELLYGIEIKSDADTYARLEKQVRYYNWYYDRNIIAAGSKHGLHVREHVPDWWGIITAEMTGGCMDFYVVREAAENPRVKAQRKICILWRRELDELLRINHLPAYRQKSRDFIRKKLLEKVPADVLWPQVMEILFERDYTQFQEE